MGGWGRGPGVVFMLDAERSVQCSGGYTNPWSQRKIKPPIFAQTMNKPGNRPDLSDYGVTKDDNQLVAIDRADMIAHHLRHTLSTLQTTFISTLCLHSQGRLQPP